MHKAILLAAGLVALASPALSQSPRPDDRDNYASDRRDRDYSFRRGREDMGRDDRDEARRGARFMIRSGDTTINVRCDGGESMRACVDATLSLVERVRPQPAATNPSANPAPNQPNR